MLKRLILLPLSFCVLSMTACIAQLPTKVEGDNKVINYNKILTSSQDCEEWNRTYALLSDGGKEDIQKEGIAANGDDETTDRAYYVLSPELVNDCKMRVEIGQFIRLVVGGTDTETDRQLAEQNSEQIVKVLRHIWNSPAFSYDGISSDKYLLLTNKGIKDIDVAPFIGELLKAEELKAALMYILVNRPLPALKPAIREVNKDAKRRNDLPKRIYSLIALAQITPAPEFIAELKTLIKSRALPTRTKQGLNIIITKFSEGEKISFADVEELGLPLPD